jgi:hypothetical protein
MRKRAAIAVGVAALVAAMAIPTLAGGATRIRTNMTGAQVVNPNGGDPDGSAKLRLRVNRVKARLCFTLRTSGLSKVTGAFIHRGAAGEIARPIITLFNTRPAGSTVKECEHNIRPRLLRRLKRKPGQHYADVTTKAYPDGAVRGQLD